MLRRMPKMRTSLACAVLTSALWVVLMGTGCGPDEPTSDLRQPEGWDQGIALVTAEDVDPAPTTVEVHLEAKPETLEIQPGLKTEVWTYNGSLPGPTIRVRKGDRLVVKFTNSLPEPTTIHWHGLRVPAAMDGTEAVQNPVLPGQTFEYAFTVPDAGTYWYHPHIRSSAQIGAGLYGAIVVEDPAEPKLGDDMVLVLSDIGIEDDGTLTPADENGDIGAYFGREGNTVLVNGRIMPKLLARVGVPQRWRAVNAARSRYFRFNLPGQKLVKVGSDGGLLERPVPVDEVTLAPGERADLYVLPAVTAERAVVVPRMDANRFNLPGPEAPGELFRFELTEDAPGFGAEALPEAFSPIELPDTTGAPVQRVELMEMQEAGGGILGINGISGNHGEHGEHEMLMSHVGTTEIWELTNTTPYDHPFHLHGFFFQVLDVDGKPPAYRELKDTLNLNPKEKVRVAVHFDDRPGMWMFHCHIVDHHELGMMGMLHVMP